MHADKNSGKLKFTSIFFWVDVIKNGHGFLAHGTLKYALSQERMY